MQRNYHDTARCSASALSWFAIRPPWVSVPRSEEELIAAGLGPYLKRCLTTLEYRNLWVLYSSVSS